MADQLARAAIAWPILLECAHQRSSIQYAELARRIGIHVRPLRYVLGVIQSYCLAERLPPLTILVVDRNGRLGSGFVAWDAANTDSGLEEVWNHDWTPTNPFRIEGAATQAELLEMINTDAAAEVWRLVADRGVRQVLFRRAVGRAYSNQCAISGCSIAEALDAAHIVPWASCDASLRLTPRNGLLLTTFHHRLFDRGIITIDATYRVRVLRKRPAVPSRPDLAMLWKLDGRKLFLPMQRRLWPDQELIRRRNDALGFNSRAV